MDMKKGIPDEKITTAAIMEEARMNLETERAAKSEEEARAASRAFDPLGALSEEKKELLAKCFGPASDARKATELKRTRPQLYNELRTAYRHSLGLDKTAPRAKYQFHPETPRMNSTAAEKFHQTKAIAGDEALRRAWDQRK
jgi:hypothetical protein